MINLRTNSYVLREIGVPPKLEKLQLNTDIKGYWVGVRMITAALCPTQLDQINRGSKNRDFLPHLLGHEGFGIVEAIGDQVSEIAVGDKVILHWRPNFPTRTQSFTHMSERGAINSGPVATFSEFVIVDVSRVTKAPEHIPENFAPFFGCSILTGFGAALLEAKVTAGEDVMIAGVGAIGLSLVQACLVSGARNIYVIDLSESAREAAIRVGATEAFANVSDFIFAMNGKSVSKYFDTTGHTEVIDQLLNFASPGALVLLIGLPTSESQPRIPVHKMLDGMRLMGSNGGSVIPQRDIPVISRYFESGQSDYTQYQTTKITFSELASVLSKNRNAELGKIIIYF